MKYKHYDLGSLRGGEIVEVVLSGNAAIVRLMDAGAFSSFRRGGTHSFYGGHATRSPVRLQVPRSDHWHVVIDLGGYAGTVRSSVNVLPGRLRPISQAPLSSLPSLLQGSPREPAPVAGEDVGREYDVFISHASEDKDAVVRPLALALQEAGLRVWFDEFELRIGDSLRRKIDRGLATSRFGVVVLSKAFFSKGWTNYELDGLVTRAVTGEQILLPIWHEVSKAEVTEYSPSLADKLARSTSLNTVEEIAFEIVEVIRGEQESSAP